MAPGAAHISCTHAPARSSLLLLQVGSERLLRRKRQGQEPDSHHPGSPNHAVNCATMRRGGGGLTGCANGGGNKLKPRAVQERRLRMRESSGDIVDLLRGAYKKTVRTTVP